MQVTDAGAAPVEEAAAGRSAHRRAEPPAEAPHPHSSALLLPRWLRGLASCSLAFLVTAAALWVVTLLLLEVALVSGALAAALLLTALLTPFHDRLRRLRAPRALAALASIVVLLGIPSAVALLVYNRITAQLNDVAAALTVGLEDVRSWLIEGPLELEADQVTRLANAATAYVQSAAPSTSTGATTGLRMLSAALLAVFAVFFLLKDGSRMWAWAQSWAPAGHRHRVRAAGEEAWTAVRSYVRGTVVIAAVDAVLIGLTLLLLGVPLWVSLGLLTFLGGFVPLLGATVAGLAAVLVTLVTEGAGDAVVALVAVVLVQQVEGNLLQPLVMGRAIRLHPLVVVVAVTCGALLLGVFGALVAVPVVAVAYRVVERLRSDARPPAAAVPPTA